ncbi:hypothetical protein CHISP_3156 [Chitinispirillum alkaliphilum]|nr:hypothetical protein CHISP_3156 [Chitinispirillum alkaliphilum]
MTYPNKKNCPVMFTIGYKGWDLIRGKYLEILDSTEKSNGFNLPFFCRHQNS